MRGPLNLSERNPVQAAIQAYSDVDEIMDRKNQRKIRDDEAAYVNQQRVDEKTLRGLATVKYALNAINADPNLDAVGKEAAKAAMWEKVPPEVREIFGQSAMMNPLYNSPGARAKTIEAAKGFENNLAQYMREKDPARRQQLKQQMIAQANYLKKGELNQGSGKKGYTTTDKRISGIIINEDGTFSINLEVDAHKDGNQITYPAPLTENRNGDPNDQPKRIGIEAFMKNVAGKSDVAMLVDLEMIRRGDFSSLNKQAIRQENREASAESARYHALMASVHDKSKTPGENYPILVKAIMEASNGVLTEQRAGQMVSSYIGMLQKDAALQVQREAANETKKTKITSSDRNQAYNMMITDEYLRLAEANFLSKPENAGLIPQKMYGENGKMQKWEFVSQNLTGDADKKFRARLAMAERYLDAGQTPAKNSLMVDRDIKGYEDTVIIEETKKMADEIGKLTEVKDPKTGEVIKGAPITHPYSGVSRMAVYINNLPDEKTQRLALRCLADYKGPKYVKAIESRLMLMAENAASERQRRGLGPAPQTGELPPVPAGFGPGALIPGNSNTRP